MESLVELIGESAAIHVVRGKLRKLLEGQPEGRRLPAILVQGETGTGKGLVARLMHRLGPRRGGPFVDINCPAIPETLLEAELFGYERGAFTDARHAKPGLLQTAHRGTLFLDEIGLLPASVQAKLLTVLEDRAVRRLGSTKTEAVDVCLISATNSDLREALRKRRFRDDLYHRLAVITLDLPPLRDRGRDVLLLAERFLARACVDYGLPPKTLGEEAQTRLLAHRWPGNIRELANVIERAALFTEAAVITGAMLGPLAAERPIPATPTLRASPSAVTPEEAMRQYLQRVLEESAGNISHAAARLGIARNTLYARLEKYGVRALLSHPTPVRRAGRPALVATPAPTGPRIQWERRGIALLRVALVEPGGVEACLHTSRALEGVIDKLQMFDGRVEELTPTGVVASFGVDRVDDAPRRAAHAAMVIHKGAARAREGTSRMPGVKMGIHVAQLLVGRSASRIDIDADAKRAQWPVLDQLLQAIAPDETGASAAAAPFLERRFELVPIGVGAGGADQPYRLTGQERRGLGLWGAMTQFVGRHDELEILRGRLAAAQHGQGQFVAVVGEPGVGKSRLLWEFNHSAPAAGWLVLESGAVPYGKATPYLPAIDLLKVYCGIAERDDQRVIREKLTGKLLALDREFEVALPAFLTLLDLPVDDRAWQTLDPAGRRRRTLDALKRFILRESQVQPLALVFEDLHWIDGETQALLEGLVESLPGARLLLLVSHRSEYAHDWGCSTSYTQLRIDPLPREGAEELLEVLLGTDPGLGPLKRLLIERTEGNPLFVEESVRALVETGAVTGTRGAYRLARGLPAIHVPGTVQDILTARIDRLPPEGKRLLETSAVIGKDFPFALLQAVANENEEMLRRGLGHLQTGEFLYETRLFPDLEYTFKHALTHEVAYGSLLHDRRRDLHAQIVGAIERFYQDRLTEHVERLAHHAMRGEMWEQAVTYLRQAGVKALVRSANREAVGGFEQALTALGHLPETRERLERGIDLRFDLRTALFPLGEFERIFGCLREAEGLARTLEDRQRLGHLSVYLCHNLQMTGHSAEARAFGQNAQAIAESLRDVPLQVMGNLYFGLACVGTGDHRRAEEHLLHALQLLEAFPSQERFGQPGFPAVSVRGFLGWVLAERGKFEEGIIHGQEGLRLAEALDHPYSLANVCWHLACLHIIRGEFRHVVGVLERGLALSREWNLTFFSALSTGSLGYAYALLGRVAEGIPLLEQALSANETMGHGAHQPLFLVYLGEAYVLADRLEDAHAFAGRALTLARERGQRGREARALRLLGEVAARHDPPEKAEAHYRDALALAEELGMRPLVAHCHLGLSKLYRRRGKRQEAQEHLATATTMYRDMGMPFWLEQAEEERKVSAGESLRSSTASGSTPVRPH
jgi:transcriptional regulator with AAA-type ATPase domain/tetratricopeptide (TPR) repeat protein